MLIKGQESTHEHPSVKQCHLDPVLQVLQQLGALAQMGSEEGEREEVFSMLLAFKKALPS